MMRRLVSVLCLLLSFAMAGCSGNVINSRSSGSSSSSTVPAVPSGLQAAAGNAQIALSWTASSGATSYVVRRSTVSGGPYTQISTPTGTTYTDTGLANGTTYYYVVAAVDSAGDSANSGPANATPTASHDANSDYASRCALSGVIRCIGFDNPQDIAGTYGDNTGILSGAAAPMLDTAVFASGASSLKFTIPSNSGANTSGSYFANFSQDLSVQFGENSDFFVQWRQRFSPEFLNTIYSSGGWKQADISTGDQPGGILFSSCTALELVTQNVNLRGFAQLYDSCTGSASHGAYDGFEQPVSGTADFLLQNARPAPYCLYSQGHTTPVTYFPPSGNCFGYFPNEWMTFQIEVQTGPLVNGEFSNSYVRMWIARERQPSQPVFNWGPYNLTARDPSNPSQVQNFGKIWLLPYQTNKDATQATPVAYTWYDELILSRTRIPDPGVTVSTPGGDTTPPSVPANLSASVAGTSQINLSWSASTDNVGVAGYYVSRNGAQISTSTTTSFADTGLSAGTTYSYTVAAFDAAGNVSAESQAVSATTQTAPPPPPPSTGTSLSAIASSLQHGQWAELTGMNGWNNGGILSPTQLGCTVSDYITQYADKGAWDPINKRALFVGQAHGNCYGGLFVIYTDADNSWATGPWTPGECQSGSDANPCFNHAYEHNTTDPRNGNFYYRRAFSLYFAKYSNGTWTILPSPVPQSEQCCGGLEFFPDSNRLIFVDGDWGVWSFAPDSNTWTQVANTNAANATSGLPNLPMSSTEVIAQYDPVDKILFFGGGNNLYKMAPDGSIKALQNSPVTLGASASVSAMDPASGNLLVLAGTSMYRYMPATDTWSQVSTVLPPVLSALGGVSDGLIAIPVSTYGVIMYVKYDFTSSKVYIYKN